MAGSFNKMSYLKGDEIVISGISGRFPNADDISQFEKKLFDKVDMVSAFDEFSYITHPESPHHIGKIKGMEKFDAQFFRVTPKQAATLDPVGRKFMEQAFLAFFDAGVNPETLKGSKMGVFTSSMQSDCATLCMFYNSFNQRRFVISGCSKTMLANRISYWMDGKGPSYGFDNGCSGSTAALEMAYNRIRNGEIDCALVGGSNFCIHPSVSVNMRRAGLLCLDGKTKCFDKNGDGFVRSDAINVYFLQKAKDAKRIYAEVYHVKGKYFAAPDGSFSLTRDPKELEKFYEEFYSQVDVSPKDIEYLEANAFGIAKSDSDELESIGNFFSKDKTTKIGCVKSNMGNSESASGACAVIKMCLAYQRGLIPGNLHYNKPQDNIQAIEDGRLQVVTENMPFNRTFTAINNFCYTGSNFHALLKGHYKPKEKLRYKSNIPHLMLVSGRKEVSVTKVLDILENSPIDPEQYALLNNIFKFNIPGHTGRGFTILDSNEEDKTISLCRSFDFYSGNVRPIWFMYSGMGSQWAGMGESLLQLPIFAAAIDRCHKALHPKGLDIIKVITDKDNASLNILNSLVAITAIQIGLTDVLKSIGIFPDKIIGHSVGELASAYADESLTVEQTILASYSRAIVSYETDFIKGKMAAVGLGHKETLEKTKSRKSGSFACLERGIIMSSSGLIPAVYDDDDILQVGALCPSEIEVACHNSSESATISGPADIVTKFVKSLTDQGIFAKEVASSDIAFHSRYIAKAGPTMLALQKEFITQPKLRSQKWVSTCYLPKDWDKAESKYASAEYFTHNLLSSVLFEEAATFIPDDAIIIEIAPHGLLQAILKRSHSQCLNLSLTRRGEHDSVKLLLEGVGKLYQAGLNPDVDKLYPQIEFPVSSETPGLSHFIEWDHSADWPLDKFTIEKPEISLYKEFIFSLHDDDYVFLKDHIRNGYFVLPESIILIFVWETLAVFEGVNYQDLSVVFDKVKFYKEIIVDPQEKLYINVTIQRASSKFEIINNEIVIADGFINTLHDAKEKIETIICNDSDKHLNRKDIYTLMNIRGYSYKKQFQSLISTNIERSKATIEWTKQWIYFLDGIIQFKALSKNHDGISTVTLINQLTIDVNEHRKQVKISNNGIHSYNAQIQYEVMICGGVTVENLILNDIPKPDIISSNLLTHKYVAHTSLSRLELKTALLINLQVVNENVSGDIIKIKEFIAEKDLLPISHTLKQWVNDIPKLNVDIEVIDAGGYKFNVQNIDIDVVILTNIEYSRNVIQELDDETFILVVADGILEKSIVESYLALITFTHTSNKTILLLKNKKQYDINDITVVQADEKCFNKKLKNYYEAEKHILFVLEKKPQMNLQGTSIMKSVKQLKNISLFVIDSNSPKFALSDNYYREQILKGLKVNVHVNNKWGSYYYTTTASQYSRIQNFELVAKDVKDIESFTWIEAPVKSNKESVQVIYSGLSSKDSQKFYNAEKTRYFGMDFSGIDSRGQRVMGLLPQGAISSTVEADSELLWPVPHHWSLAEAATVPLPYVHAFYCLAFRGFLYRNTNVLVTGAAGALGQAVIAVALSLNCTVFATVSNAEKKNFLLRLFPELDANNIVYTYDASYHDMVITETKSKRCHIVISCASGTARQNAMSCVGDHQRFLDINNTDAKNNNNYTMGFTIKDQGYKFVDMSTIFLEKYKNIKKVLQAMVSDGIAKGYVRPITSVVYSPSNISRAFRLLSQNNNRGRVLIHLRDLEITKKEFEVIPRTLFSSSKTYIVVSDGSQLSTELIHYLVQRGATRIIVHVNPKKMNGYFYVRYASWNAVGATIEFNSDDTQTELGCKHLINNANKSGAIDGIFTIINDTENNTNIINDDNVNAALVVSNLDLVSRICGELRYFVVISAKSCHTTNENIFLDIEKYCYKRQEEGLPSLFLQNILEDTVLEAKSLSTIFNAMESSIKYNYGSVLSNVRNNTENYTKTSKTNFSVGLQAFFTHILKNEITAAEPIIQMKTKSSIELKHELLIDPKGSYLMMIPGLDGNFKALTSLSEGLKKPAITLQLSPNLEESIPEMAKKLLNYAQNRYHLKSPFYLMGYSFGVNVALEMASILEAQGLVGVVFCLDSSPDAMRIHLNAYLGEMTDEQLQNSLIEHIFKLFAGIESTELKCSLKNRTDWSDKVEVFINHVKKHVTHTHPYLKNVLEAAYKRIKLAFEYRPKFKLESELVLLKGIPHPNAEELSNDYNLHKYTTKPIQVFDIESDHALAHLDCRVSNFINRTLLY